MTSLRILSAFYFALSMVGLFFMTKSDNLSADIAFLVGAYYLHGFTSSYYCD